MIRIGPGKALLWALLALPALPILRRTLTEPDLWWEDLLQPTGEWSARLIIFALMLTPLSMLLPRRRWVQWLMRHRRAFGVAAFGYSLLHLLFYVIAMETVRDMVAELDAPAIWTAWLAFLCLVPMALTSNDASMRALKAGWKRIQRLAYPAAFLTLAHWALVHDGLTEALLNFAPLIALQLYRLARLSRPLFHTPRRIT
ncbi:MAG TPA: ferric reductase-like transmembrane domain-containing protein [Allosphingosinicella sp.]|jgi:sulfoxide reductase heme-binding subunit YedZ